MRSLRLLALVAIPLAALGCEPREEVAPPHTVVTPHAPQTVAPMPPLPEEPPPISRLPADVKPLHGRLVLEVVPDRDRFTGVIEIAVNLEKPRDVIWLHEVGLTTKLATVRPEGFAPVVATLVSMNPGGLAALRLARPIEAGRATIHIEFDGAFGTRNEGLYKVKRAGKSYAFTQFESIFARQVFPCFDEPSAKTPWDVTIFAPKGQVAVANTREIERIDAPNNLERFTFATTQPLPPYLLALAVGPLDVVAAPPLPPTVVRKEPLQLRGVAVQGRGKDLAYALAESAKVIGALETYTDVAYPFDKLDIIAVPEKQGAMENAGAVTFGENSLLVDEKSASFEQRRLLASIIAHEFAHQWFGDLVTMSWWDDTWLNESFATWAQARIVDGLYPNYGAGDQAIARGLDAMGIDALVAARAIRQPVVTNDDIENAFDAITYSKGGAVLGMFERYTTGDVFKKGLHGYLEAHRFGNATEQDLLTALTTAAGKDIGAPMTSFLEQPGVPYVETKLTCEADKPRLHLKQSRYLPLGSKGDARGVWQVPVCVSYGYKKGFYGQCTLLMQPEADLDLKAEPGAGCPAWLHPNAGGAGYYYFSLDADLSKKLVAKGWPQLLPAERLTFAASLKAAFARGTIDAADVLAAADKLAQDPNPLVADVPGAFLMSVAQWLEGDPARAKILDEIRKLYAPVMHSVGWAPKKGETEPPERQQLRDQTIRLLAGFARDPAVRAEAVARGRAFLGEGKGGDHQIHTDAVARSLAPVALQCALQDGEDALFDQAVAKLAATDEEWIRSALLFAIGSIAKPSLNEKARQLTFSPALRRHEVASILTAQLREPATREEAWTWFKAHAADVMALFPPSRASRAFSLAARFCDAAHAEDAQKVFAPFATKLQGGPRELATTVEYIELCAKKREVQEPSVRARFGSGTTKKKKP